MGYLDGITEGNFKKGINGEFIFFPRGKFGRGYELPDAETYHSIKNFVKVFFLAGSLLVMFFCYSFGWIYSLLLLLFLYVFYEFRIRKFTHNLIPSSERLTFVGILKNQAKSYNLFILCALEVCCLFFLFVFFSMLLRGSGGFLLLPVILILLFGFGSIVFGFMINEKRKH